MGILGLYAVVVLIWGSTWIAIQFQLSVAPEAAVAYRFALATLILMAWCGLRRLPMRFSRRDHLFMAALGVCLFSFNYVLIYIASIHLTSGLLAVVFSTIVIMNMINGAIFFHRRPETRTVIGAVLGMAGISLVFARDLAAFDLATGGSIGLLLSLAGSYIASLGNMASARNHGHGIPVMQANAFGMLYGTVMLFGYIAVAGVPLTFDTSPSFLGALVYLALFGSVIGFGTYLTLLGKIGPDRASYSSVMFPVVALLLSTWFEDFIWTGNIILGVGLTMLGNVVILTKRMPKPASLVLAQVASEPVCDDKAEKAGV
ncbi:EamA family transporter [Thalassospira sp. GB04J01]|uniref:DMT family transporter n=1 Tax=Thalassospira sp. GB04J01 TaxID=1485225 RepID=UPI000C9D11AF|nr:EamA family transporter [Thalassospira sp. GB04J01]|tara:strand:+ start:132843 stop:133790 length:948 start_codon:yes stop_codon:yes gene_type:complete